MVPYEAATIPELISIRKMMERAIFEVLEWPYDPRDEKAVPEGLRVLGNWIHKMGSQSNFAIISTNYDECIETELYRRLGGFPTSNFKINYGLSWRDCPSGKLMHSNADARYSVFKLHGSVDWLKCELCDYLVCHDEKYFKKDSYFKVCYENFKSSLNSCHCGHWPLRPVAPSTVRDVRDTNLLSVWKGAFEALRTAGRWYIIGYSLPTEDVAIRSMLIRAYHGRKAKPQVEVVQYGEDDTTRARYHGYFSECKYRTDGMLGFVKTL